MSEMTSACVLAQVGHDAEASVDSRDEDLEEAACETGTESKTIMTAFCLDTITCDDSLRPNHGVLRLRAFAVTSDARQAAQRIHDAAEAQAQAILHNARAEADRLAQEAEMQTLQRADALIKALEQAHATFLQQAEDIIIELAKGLFDRLVLDATPREKLEAGLKRIAQEAPARLVSAQLRVHPEDLASLPEVEWEVKTDATLMPGTCQLEATCGEWRADFSAGAEAIRLAFEQATSR